MNKRALKKNIQSGFTIIEVMIVLAIAGVILLMVFLAIPALQRNNRNTQTRNDVASVLGFVNEFSTNNTSKLPSAVCTHTTANDGNIYAVLTGACGNPQAIAANLIGTVRAGASVDSQVLAPAGTAAARANLGEMRIVMNGDCTLTGSVWSSSYKLRSTAMLFRVETAGVAQGITQCQTS